MEWAGHVRAGVRDALAPLREALIAHGGVEITLFAADDQITLNPVLEVFVYATTDRWTAILGATGLSQERLVRTQSWKLRGADSRRRRHSAPRGNRGGLVAIDPHVMALWSRWRPRPRTSRARRRSRGAPRGACARSKPSSHSPRAPWSRSRCSTCFRMRTQPAGARGGGRARRFPGRAPHAAHARHALPLRRGDARGVARGE